MLRGAAASTGPVGGSKGAALSDTHTHVYANIYIYIYHVYTCMHIDGISGNHIGHIGAISVADIGHIG